MVVYGVMALSALVVPLLVVSPLLYRIKRKALFEYGGLVTSHNQMFEEKWIHSKHPPDQVILGNPDASSFADLGSSFAVVLDMSVVPIDKITLVRLVIAAALPMLPVLLFATPANEVIRAVLVMLG